MFSKLTKLLKAGEGKNLKKYDANTWGFYTNQSDLDFGMYTYYGYAEDISSNVNVTETRQLGIMEQMGPMYDQDYEIS